MTDRQSSLGSLTSHRQPAQALALAGLLLGLVLLPLVGLAVDVEIVFSAHRTVLRERVRRALIDEQCRVVEGGEVTGDSFEPEEWERRAS